MPPCQPERDDVLSTERGQPGRPHVYRCARCGFVFAPTSFAASQVHRVCRWFDPTKAGFQDSPPCWCHGLGDVIAAAAAWLGRQLPQGERVVMGVGRAIDRVETWLTRREREKHPEDRGCGGCDRRRVSLNGRFPLHWLRKKICPPTPAKVEAAGDTLDVCFVFPHGFGDAVQFTAVLRHLRKHRPQWRVSVYCKIGAHSLFRNLVHKVGVFDRDGGPAIYREDFALVRNVPWYEPEETYCDSPATKVERCLREMFAIQPEPALWQYEVHPEPGDVLAATRSLRETFGPPLPDGRFPVVALHYQGNSWREAKNLDEEVARQVVAAVRAAGWKTLILDWETPPRSLILQEKTRGVRCFAAEHPLWKGLGVGDGSALCALLAHVALLVGIDSGPEHLAVAAGTPTIVTWGKRSHPVNYFCPAHHVVHLVRRDQGKAIFGDRDRGERFFRSHYNYVELDRHLRVVLPELVARRIAAYDLEPRPA